MKNFPGKSVYSIHKGIAKELFKQLKYVGEDAKALRRTFVAQYFHDRTEYTKKEIK